tara:strand:+ start:2276 stop:2893 length:618 start_codon:yes stop_codon:yes gene_type:complete
MNAVKHTYDSEDDVYIVPRELMIETMEALETKQNNMSLISGMDEVIAYIKTQDEKIKNLETNEKVREELIVEMKDGIQNIIDVKDTEIANLKRRKPEYKELRSEIAELKKKVLSKEDVDKTAKLICDLFKQVRDLKAQLKFEEEQSTITIHQNQSLLNENGELKAENEKMKQKESVCDEVFEGLKKNEKEYIHRNNILQKKNEET